MKKLYVPADKTTNLYKVSVDEYEKLLDKNIQNDYKKSTITDANKLLNIDKGVAEELDLDDRIEIPAKSEAYITLKDHKENFHNNPKCRLLNPNKSNIGQPSKHILQRINNNLRSKLNLNQWRSTQDVISWFNRIPNKHKQLFIQFDICEFYPSISVQLLSEALDWAQSITNISKLDRDIIMTAKNTLLYSKNVPWCKRNNQNFFDVTMGSYDGAESCELVGLFILSKLKAIDIDLGLYRDDGLGYSCKTRMQIEIQKQQICKVFEELGLRIDVEVNLKIVNFLDVTFDLSTGLFKPYLKPNNTIQYVHTSSNHPKHVIENIPKGVEQRLSMLSSNEVIFDEAIPPYQDALKRAGHKHTLKFNPPQDNNQSKRKRNRKRDILWLNLPFSKTLKTKTGKRFLEILDKCFPPSNPLSKIFNRHTVKVSYTYLPNIGKIISGHNKKNLTKEPQVENLCNCRVQNSCPVANKCLLKNVIYQAIVKRQDNQKVESYIGLTSTSFKERWSTHKSSFKLQSHANDTKLSAYIWKLKREGVNFDLSWKIVSKSNAYNP